MPVLSYQKTKPKIADSCFVAPNAHVVGDVEIGSQSSIWFGTVVRGDVHSIRIGARVNIQDNSVVHVTEGQANVQIADDVTIGHRAIIHGCGIHAGALIGMGAILMDGAVVGAGALVGAGAVVTEGTHIPAGMLALGAPAKIKRPLTDEERAYLLYSSKHYVEVASHYLG